MKYGKWLRSEVERSLPEWRGEFISYKLLKKHLNLIDPGASRGNKRLRITIEDLIEAGNGRDELNLMMVTIGFTLLLDEELQKVNAFYIEKEEDYIIKLKELKNREANLDYSGKEMLNLQKEALDFHAEMVSLLHYSFLNSTGFMKIVKKHKKRAGSPNVQLSFVPRVLEQAFFSTDLLYNLMKECEAILHRLFLAGGP